MKNGIYVYLLSIFITGCDIAAQHEDVSNNFKYKELINSSYELTDYMNISGVNLPPGYGKDINIYTIDPTSPSWSGPELITRDKLPVSTILTIQSIRECTNCLFDTIIEAVVTVEPYKKAVNVMVVIDLENLTSNKYANRIN